MTNGQNDRVTHSYSTRVSRTQNRNLCDQSTAKLCVTLVHHDFHTDETISQVQDALERFHQYCVIFETTGVCPDGFPLPRQHSLVHYPKLIRMFGAPNGLCSLMTEAKHIKAVKEPWWRSSCYEALGQMLLTNQRLDKLAAAHINFASQGMLDSSVVSSALHSYGTLCPLSFHSLTVLCMVLQWTDRTDSSPMFVRLYYYMCE
jgi:hypothetical protein